MQKLFILGTKINDISLDESITEIQKLLKQQNKGFIVTPNPEICLKAYKDKFLRRIIKKSFISIPDGFGLKIGAIIFGKKLHSLTTGIDLCWELLKLAEQNNYSILFFEGQPKIGERAIEVIKQKYPKLKINYFDPGRVDNKGNFENQNLISQINNFQPDIILVNFGCPKQEYFINNNIDKLETKLMLGIGGSLDFMAGRLKRAPKFWRKLGLEWLWRLIQEPNRWKRILKAVIVFPLACLRFRIGNLFFYRNNVAGFIINKDKQILITKHYKFNYWQFPQGGAKKAKTEEELKEAILRELKDEIGTSNLKPIKVLKNCYKYKWGKGDTHFDQFKGQKQSLILLEFLGDDKEIKLSPYEHKDWQWISKNDILNKIAKFKKPLVKIGLENFKQYL